MDKLIEFLFFTLYGAAVCGLLTGLVIVIAIIFLAGRP